MFTLCRQAMIMTKIKTAHELCPLALPLVAAEKTRALDYGQSPAQPRARAGESRRLRLAAARLNGLLIAPGEWFSFRRAVGRLEERPSWKDRLLGRARPAPPGGAIDQMVALIDELAAESRFERLTERGDYRFLNNTAFVFQLLFALEGEIMRAGLRREAKGPTAEKPA
ncbi:MAG: VanW family protein [Candidatus Adiutrix sp.]|jgi:hypothetical protein|nr:VanW family protein [Candidatus Adiutrix sp.]